ncbi:GNAT family N-acetyltransferase [Actinophytocola sp.]|uniref:GNAT family N-acetyltransferase n=1 Tax=Actinophytocola sp. TaxID=1872138 RepID=UPI002ED1D396
MSQLAEGARPERITTERLVLRKIVPEDVDAMVALHADPDAVRHRPEGLRGAEHSTRLFSAWLDHWNEFGFGYWALELVGTKELVGFGGLQMASDDWAGTYLNVFYRLFPEFWGRGYAPEMVVAAVEWGRRVYPHLPIFIITPTVNVSARRVAEKVGFIQVREAFFQGAVNCFFRSPG